MNKLQKIEPEGIIEQPVVRLGEAQSMIDVIARAASDPNTDVAKMERLYAVLKEEQSRIAVQKFNQAMKEVQSEIPSITKDGKNPSTNSRYLQLETLTKVAKPIYAKHGFSLVFSEGQSHNPSKIRVLCNVKHDGGHSEIHWLDLSPDDTGAKGNASKTKIHGEGSTFSYGQRYLTKLILNVTIANEDDDGNQGNKVKPEGMSAKAAPEPTLREYADQLWRALGDVCRGDKNWDRANQFLWREDILDGAIPETAPNLSAKRFQEAIAKVKELQNA
jgi:hypothetical protein